MATLIRTRGQYAIGVMLIAAVSYLGYAVLSPRFNVPPELRGTAGGEELQRELERLTANQGWFKTDASLKNLRKQTAIATQFEPVRAALFPNVEFYWVHLKTSHMFKSNAVSAPFSDSVVAVDVQSKRVWSFHETKIATEIVPFMNAFEIALNDVADVKNFWTLYNSLHLCPAAEVDVHHVRDQEWVIAPRKSTSMPGLRLELDAKHQLSKVVSPDSPQVTLTRVNKRPEN